MGKFSKIDEDTWIEWRCQLGCRKHEARALFRKHQALLLSDGVKARFLKPRTNETFEQAWRAFLDGMPRKPFRFLAMVAEIEKRRAIKKGVGAKRAAGRARYERRMRRNS